MTNKFEKYLSEEKQVFKGMKSVPHIEDFFESALEYYEKGTGNNIKWDIKGDTIKIWFLSNPRDEKEGGEYFELKAIEYSTW